SDPYASDSSQSSPQHTAPPRGTGKRPHKARPFAAEANPPGARGTAPPELRLGGTPTNHDGGTHKHAPQGAEPQGRGELRAKPTTTVVWPRTPRGTHPGARGTARTDRPPPWCGSSPAHGGSLVRARPVGGCGGAPGEQAGSAQGAETLAEAPRGA